MDSKIYGVPLSTTHGSPPANISLFTSTGIRAPVTIDDSDFEYSLSANGQKNTNSSYYGSDSEGFVSGEGEFETASERLFMSDPDEQQTHFVNQFVVSRPFVKIPDEEIVERGSSVGGSDDSRSSLTDPCAETIEGHDEYSDRPFVVDREILEGHDGYSDISVVDGGEYEVATGTSMDGSDKDISLEEPKVVDSATQGIPIAQLSWDSEDDEYLSTGVSEDNDVFDAFGIPNAVVLDRLDSASKVRISDVSDGEEYESESENVIQSGMTEDLIFTKNIEMVLGSESKEEDKAENDTVQNFITEEAEANDTLEEGKVLYQVASKESTLSGQELDNDEILLAEESHILDSSVEAKSADSSLDVKPSDTAYTSPRDENSISKFGADELNSGSSSILLTGASGDSQKSESNEDRIYQGNDCQDIATRTETESYKPIKDSELESLECTEVSVPPTAEEQVYSSASFSSDVTWSSTVEDDLPKLSDKTQHTEACLNPDLETNSKDVDPVNLFKNEEVPFLHENDRSFTFDGSGGMNLIIDQLDQQIATADYYGEVSQGQLPKVDGEIVTELDEVDTDEESEENEMFDAAALAALLRAATGVSLELPGSSGSTFHSSRPGQPTNAEKFPLSENKSEGTSTGILSEEEKKKLELNGVCIWISSENGSRCVRGRRYVTPDSSMVFPYWSV